MYGDMIANFEKGIKYTNKDGEYVNDGNIKIKIEFHSDFDYENNYKDSDGEFKFDSKKGKKFIKNILNGRHGGSRKRIIKRKNTRKNNGNNLF